MAIEELSYVPQPRHVYAALSYQGEEIGYGGGYTRQVLPRIPNDGKVMIFWPAATAPWGYIDRIVITTNEEGDVDDGIIIYSHFPQAKRVLTGDTLATPVTFDEWGVTIIHAFQTGVFRPEPPPPTVWERLMDEEV